MINLVELAADDDEQRQSPCLHGNIVDSHACYCHDDAWEDGPRKCPIWRWFGESDVSKWHRREWTDEGMDVELGGCPHFVPAEQS